MDEAISANWSGRDYVALGSSFAAGPEVGTRVPGSPRRATRSQSNYPHLLADALQLRLRDVTSSGAATADILTESQYGQPRQLDAVRAETSLVTVTIGGNDVGYVQMLVGASLSTRLGRLPVVGRRLAATRRADPTLEPAALDARLQAVTSRLTLVAEAIRSRAPRARIVFVDYLTLLPPEPQSYRLPITADQAALGRSIAGRLEAATAGAVAATGTELLRASTASREHHPWSPEPWSNGFVVPKPFGRRRGAPFHPNQAGMRAIAELLAEQLRRPAGFGG